MQIPLSEFEQIINRSILSRGLAYYNEGNVIDFSEIESGVFEAIIEGTNQYTVQLYVNNDIVEEVICDCPYDMGPVCKHIVAAIYYLEFERLKLDVSKVEKPKKAKSRSISNQIKDILKKLPQDELGSFIEKQCKKDRQFRTIFLSTFSHLTDDNSKSFYQKQIRSILTSATGRDQFMFRPDMKYVLEAISPFLESADQNLIKGNYETVIHIATSILEEMTEAINFADDSDGEIAYLIDHSLNMLYHISDDNTSKTIKSKLFSYCIGAFQNNLFKGWDWHLSMLDLASDNTSGEKDMDTIFKFLDHLESEYQRELGQLIKLSLLKKFKTDKEVESYINNNLDNTQIRKQEIEKAINKKDFKKAIKLCNEAIEKDKINKPGLLREWYDCLLDIALKQKDITGIIKYARYRFIDDYRSTKDYYSILKKHISKKDWNEFLEDLIFDIKKKGRWSRSDLIREIYIKEKWWDRLLELLHENIDLNEIERNEPYLIQDYKDEIIEMYAESITKFLSHNTGRKYYKVACKYLKRMKKLGANDKVDDLIADFSKEYYKRRALLEELSKV